MRIFRFLPPRHHWKSGQDQTHLIKRELANLAPSLKIFLDVDDLSNASPEALEMHIGETAVVLMFLSRGYFTSKACEVEFRATIKQKKPIILVHEADPDHGGGTLEELSSRCPADLVDKIFTKTRPLIPWVRQPAFQLLNFKHIVALVLDSLQAIKYAASKGKTSFVTSVSRGQILRMRRKSRSRMNEVDEHAAARVLQRRFREMRTARNFLRRMSTFHVSQTGTKAPLIGHISLGHVKDFRRSPG